MTGWALAFHRRRKRVRFAGTVAAAVLAAAAGTGIADAEPPGTGLTYAGSIQVSTGHYIFPERTTSVYVLNGIDLTAGRFVLSASVPVVFQSTPWVTVAPVPIPSGGTASAQVGTQIQQHIGRGPGGAGRSLVVTLPVETVSRQAGVGDPVFRGAFGLVATPATAIRVSAALKAPVARYDDGFGTGQWDAGAGIAIERALGANRAFGVLEFWRIGDLTDLILKDAAMYQAGYEQVLGEGRWSALASVQGWTTILEGAGPPIDVSFGIARHLAGSRSIGMTVAFGVTETAPDVALALQWRLPF